MHGSSHTPELFIYIGHKYFTDFCTRVHKFLSEKVHFTFSSAYSIDPLTSDGINLDGPHVIIYGEGDLDSEEPHHQLNPPNIAKPTYQYSNSNTNPTTQVTWSDDTKTPSSSGITTPSKPRYFQLRMDLTYRDGMGKSLALV